MKKLLLIAMLTSVLALQSTGKIRVQQSSRNDELQEIQEIQEILENDEIQEQRNKATQKQIASEAPAEQPENEEPTEEEVITLEPESGKIAQEETSNRITPARNNIPAPAENNVPARSNIPAPAENNVPEEADTPQEKPKGELAQSIKDKIAKMAGLKAAKPAMPSITTNMRFDIKSLRANTNQNLKVTGGSGTGDMANQIEISQSANQNAQSAAGSGKNK